MSIDDPTIPQIGWYFQLGPKPRQCKVWHDGKPVQNVTRLSFEVDAKFPLVVAHVDTIGATSTAALPDEQVKTCHREIQLGLPGLENTIKNSTDLKQISLKQCIQWLFTNAKDCIDYDIVIFFATHAEKIFVDEIDHPETTGDTYYDFIDFHLANGVEIRWSLDEGWNDPVEEALRALWNLVRYGR